MKHSLRIAWIAIRELLYERVFYVLIFFAGVALGLSMVLGQMTYAERTKLTLDFMLGGIEISMVLFSVFMGISLFHREIAMGSVSMVLSKPIARGSFLVGKYLGQVAVQLMVIFFMCLITLVATSGLESEIPLSTTSIIQACFLIFVEICVLTAIAYFFAVNSNAITSAIATLSLFWLGHFRAGAVEKMGEASSRNPIWVFAQSFIPDLEVFNMKSLASYGLTIPWTEIGLSTLYGLCCLLFFLVLATVCFNRKDILT